MIQAIRSPALPTFLRRSIGKVVTARLRCYSKRRGLFVGKKGLELGGKSQIFSRRGLFPIYPVAGDLDNCNFSRDTVWAKHESMVSGFQFDTRKKPGRQFYGEALKLDFAEDESYDFALSSHMIEHSANPIQVLIEMKRVTVTEGAIFLVIPHRDGTFDHRRPVTPLQHLISDFDQHIDESDLTHLPEIFDNHDLSMDPGGGDLNTFKIRSFQNHENRCLHHHVFDGRSAVQLVDYVGLKIVDVELVRPCHIAILAIKTSSRTIDNAQFLAANAAHLKDSPFASDTFIE